MPPGAAAPALSYPLVATSSPRAEVTVSWFPTAVESGPLGTSRKTSSSVGRSGVKTTVSVPVTVRRSSAREKSRSTTGRSGSGSLRSRGHPPASVDGAALELAGAAVPVVEPVQPAASSATASGRAARGPLAPPPPGSAQRDEGAGQREDLLAAAGDGQVHPDPPVLPDGG